MYQRLDIQGLRMVAVLTVFAFHLFGWPRGGFIGVDVFFVISGFLITGNLLRMAERRGNVSFKKFYWNRIRRIVPAATVVLILTYAASVLVFQPFRAQQVGIDAVSGFVFMSNWWFAAQATDYFAADDAVSPIQHYWSLSIEEQFYFVWPALIFVIGLIVARKVWTHGHRMRLAAAVMGCVVGASLGWSLYETAASPTWAYFNTFARVWELGVGALLATAVGILSRIPAVIKPWLSWSGLSLIAASLFLIAESSAGFPAPWALLPVAGAALVIAAGVQGEPAGLQFLQNPASVYVGNISYSLYLVHWPVIVILSALMPRSEYYYLVAVALTFGLAIASFHFIENPLRYADWEKIRSAAKQIRNRGYELQRSSKYAALAAISLLTLSITAYSVHPIGRHATPPPAAVIRNDDGPQSANLRLGPLASALQQELAEALTANEWPDLEPSVESVINSKFFPDIEQCNGNPNPQDCTWGSPSAPIRVLLVGDSIALTYAGPLRNIALNSNGRVQVHLEALAACRMVNFYPLGDGPEADQAHEDICEARKQHTIEVVNDAKPNVVIIANAYNDRPHDRGGVSGWFDYRREIVDQFRNSADKVVWLSAPPQDKSIAECYATATSVPADCISQVTDQWLCQPDLGPR